jgi:hypothetical protein
MKLLIILLSPATFETYIKLAEMPGVARDSIRNEGIREINDGII